MIGKTAEKLFAKGIKTDSQKKQCQPPCQDRCTVTPHRPVYNPQNKQTSAAVQIFSNTHFSNYSSTS